MSRQELIRPDSGPQLPSLPGIASLPKMSRHLSWAVEGLENPHPDVSAIGAVVAYPDAIRQEAGALAKQMRPLRAAVTEAWLREWAQPLGAAVSNPPAAEDFDAWISSLYIAAHGMPIGAFTLTTIRSALSEFRFWPSVADVIKLTDREARKLTMRYRTLRKVAKAESAPPPAPYVIPPAPEWVHSREVRGRDDARDGGSRYSSAKPPQRTVEEQLAELGFSPDGKARK